MNLTAQQQERLVANARTIKGDHHMVFLDSEYTREDGSIQVTRDDLNRFLHRILWDDIYPTKKVKRGEYLELTCGERKCFNPYHRKKTRRPAMSVAPGSAPMKKKARMFCLKAGHPLQGDNVYLHTDKKGYVHRECRACSTQKAADRRAAANR